MGNGLESAESNGGSEADPKTFAQRVRAVHGAFHLEALDLCGATGRRGLAD